ncbi:MAG: hypothetical protein JNL57_13400 [Bacteroidetes bacterium]|nr:hypothetical protein [Bacteroidota bacterium]
MSRWKRHIPIFLFCLVIAVLFSVSVVRRLPYWGGINRWHHQYLTGSTLKFTTNWYEEGFLLLKGAMVENPPGPEFGTGLKARKFYVSYGTGSQIPVWLLARISGNPPSVRMIQGWNLFNQFLIGLILGWIVWSSFAGKTTRWLGLVPPAFYYFLPVSMYYHMPVYFSDQAVILWVVLYGWLYCRRFAPGGVPKSQSVLLAFVAFYGTLTDWLMLFVVAGFFGVSFIMKRRSWQWKPIIMEWLPVVSASLLVALHAWYLGEWETLLGRGLLRASSAPASYGPPTPFAQKYWGEYVGWIPSILVWAGVLTIALYTTLFYRKRNPVPALFGFFLSLGLAFLLHTFVLRNHAREHEFSALKWQILLALLPVLPFFIRVFQSRTVLVAGLMGSAAYLVWQWPNNLNLFEPPELEGMEAAQWLKTHAAKDEIWFGANFEIPDNPPQLLAISRKRVYPVQKLKDMESLFYWTGLRPAKAGLIFHGDAPGAAPDTLHPLLKNGTRVGRYTTVYVLNLPVDTTMLNLPLCRK